ncbi:VanZ family protein [Streptomyces sp. NPDC094448]|uniref:VanZ family protein n=1 Tax=Streptomyces sp. NPDC094448 TaxID=3366063 RepID=UPI0038255C53
MARAVRMAATTWALLVLLATLMPTQPLGSGAAYISWELGGGLWGTSSDYGAGLFEQEGEMVARLQIANAVMFVPLGALFAFRRDRVRAATAIAWCFAASVAIEALQLAMAAGRTVDIDDVLFNTLGGVLGAVTAQLATAITEPRKREGKRRRPHPRLARK